METAEIDYSPKPNDWFSPNVEYVGVGTAKFTKLIGTLQGQTHVHYDEFGNHQIQMTVEKIIFDGTEINDVPFRLPYFFAGIESGVRDRKFGIVPQAINNPCESLTVATAEGSFIATDLGTQYHPAGFMSAGQTEVVFEPLQAYFETGLPSSERYFVVPLINFLNNSGWLTRYYPEIAQHPMRLFRSPSIPEHLSSDEKNTAYMQQAFGQSVTRFLFLDEPAFLEPLKDYEDREKQLEDGTYKCLITSIMVGSVGEKKINHLNWGSLGFRDLLPLLSLATGIYVGSPWLEIRDNEGKLIRRIHTNLAKRPYKAGISAFGVAVDRGGLGYLLSVAQKSGEFGKPHLRAAISQIVMGGYFDFDGNIEDRMSHLFRGLNRLCEEYTSRKRTVFLKPERRRALKKIIKEATKAIDGLADTLPSATTDDEAQQEANELKRIAEGIRGVKSSPLGFPRQIELLLDKFNLQDAQILDKHFEVNPGPEDTRKWSDVIVYYRNRVMHSAWFDWDSQRQNLKELSAVAFHLHDILVRLVLIILGYDEKYEPSIFKIRGSSKEIGWVQASGSSAEDLGFECKTQG